MINIYINHTALQSGLLNICNVCHWLDWDWCRQNPDNRERTVKIEAYLPINPWCRLHNLVHISDFNFPLNCKKQCKTEGLPVQCVYFSECKWLKIVVEHCKFHVCVIAINDRGPATRHVKFQPEHKFRIFLRDILVHIIPQGS